MHRKITQLIVVEIQYIKNKNNSINNDNFYELRLLVEALTPFWVL